MRTVGIIEEVGSGVTAAPQGGSGCDAVQCRLRLLQDCQAGFTGFCLNVNPGFAGGAYGYVAMGPYMGGQAEYLRIPYAEFNCLVLPRAKSMRPIS